MAKRVSELPSVDPVDGNELVALVQSSTSKKASLKQIQRVHGCLLTRSTAGTNVFPNTTWTSVPWETVVYDTLDAETGGSQKFWDVG